MTIKLTVTDLNPGDSYNKQSIVFLNSDTFTADSEELVSYLLWHHSKTVTITSEVIL